MQLVEYTCTHCVPTLKKGRTWYRHHNYHVTFQNVDFLETPTSSYFPFGRRAVLCDYFTFFSCEEGDLPKMAKAPTLAKNLEKELECAVCLEQFKDPKVLPCLHSFCKICLEGLVDRKRNAWKLICPSCRISVEVSLWMWCIIPCYRDVKPLSIRHTATGSL